MKSATIGWEWPICGFFNKLTHLIKQSSKKQIYKIVTRFVAFIGKWDRMGTMCRKKKYSIFIFWYCHLGAKFSTWLSLIIFGFIYFTFFFRETTIIFRKKYFLILYNSSGYHTMWKRASFILLPKIDRHLFGKVGISLTGSTEHKSRQLLLRIGAKASE